MGWGADQIQQADEGQREKHHSWPSWAAGRYPIAPQSISGAMKVRCSWKNRAEEQKGAIKPKNDQVVSDLIIQAAYFAPNFVDNTVENGKSHS